MPTPFFKQGAGWIVGALAVLLALFLAPAQSHAMTPDQVCAGLQEVADSFNAEAPRQGLGASESLRMVVDCEARALEHVMRLLVEESDLDPGWKDDFQPFQAQQACGSEGIARRLSWTLKTTVLSKNDVVLMTMTTAPQDCD